jgi:CheY-like chemotaxis protein
VRRRLVCPLLYEERMTLTVLAVDDEKSFTASLAVGLRTYDSSLRVVTADNGLEAVQVLESQPVDLVLTDVRMPQMDGFELLAHMSRHFPSLPVLVMTAFGTPDIERQLAGLGVNQYIEKPVDLEALAGRIMSVLANGASGNVRGITLPTFVQMIEIEKKSCTVTVTAAGRMGRLYFERGVLLDAMTETARGEEAALEILTWNGAAMQIQGDCRATERMISVDLENLLIESCRREDERKQTTEKENDNMSSQEKLKELSAISGFAGIGVYTPQGEALDLLTADGGFTKDVGVLANNVLMNAQKASLEMGAGRGQFVHIEGEKAHVLARCCNEGTDPLKSQPGKAHIHVVLALRSDDSIGLAKMRLNSVAVRLADDFRL